MRLFNPITRQIMPLEETMSLAGGPRPEPDTYFVAIDPIPGARLAELVRALPMPDVRFAISGFRIDQLPADFTPAGVCHALLELAPGADVDAIMRCVQPRKRSKIRQALRQEYDVRWLVGESVDEPTLYAFYRDNMARHGTIPRSREQLRARLRGGVEVVAISCEGGRWAAVNVLELARPYAVVRLSLSDPRYWPRHVNEILYFESIRALAGRGFRMIDFGLTGLSDEPLRRFKRHLGGQEYPVYVYRRASPRTLRAECWARVLHRVRTLEFQMREHGVVRTLGGVVRSVSGRLRRARASARRASGRPSSDRTQPPNPTR